MAAAPSKVLTNLLEIAILTHMLNAELWDKDSAQCVAHVIKCLLLNAEMYPLFDPAKKTSHMVQWAFIEDHLLRHAHQHYPSGQTAAAVALKEAKKFSKWATMTTMQTSTLPMYATQRATLSK
jgi:hypothetical protein